MAQDQTKHYNFILILGNLISQNIYMICFIFVWHIGNIGNYYLPPNYMVRLVILAVKHWLLFYGDLWLLL